MPDPLVGHFLFQNPQALHSQAAPSNGRGHAGLTFERLDLYLPHPKNLGPMYEGPKSHDRGGGYAMARRPAALIPRLYGQFPNAFTQQAKHPH